MLPLLYFLMQHSNGILFTVYIKFGETKNIVVTFVTTTLKALLSVTKTNGWFSGRKLHACNICYLFLNILAHIPPLTNKKVRNRSHAPKNVAPSCDANFFTLPYNMEKHTKGSIHFCQKQKYTSPLFTLIVLYYSVYVARILYHTLDKL